MGSLAGFRSNTMVILQQHSPLGEPLEPYLFNCGDTESEKKRRKLSHLLHCATSLPAPVRAVEVMGGTRYFYPCLDPTNNLIYQETYDA